MQGCCYLGKTEQTEVDYEFIPFFVFRQKRIGELKTNAIFVLRQGQIQTRSLHA